MRQAKIVIGVEQHQLLPHAVLPLAQRGDPTPDRAHMLADSEVDSLHKGGVDVPTKRSQEVIDGLEEAKHPTELHSDETSPSHGFDHVRLEQLRQGHPTRLGGRAWRLPAWWLYPLPVVGQQGGHVLAKAIGE